MKKFILTAVILLLFIWTAFASQSEWSKSLNIAATLSQSKIKSGAVGRMTENSSLNYGVLINGELTKDNSEINWKNTLKLEYARNRSTIKNANGLYVSTPTWTEDIDKLVLDSVYRWKLYPKFNPYAALNFQTAMLDANFAGEAKAFRPIQLRESAGASTPFIDKEKQKLIGRAGLYYEHFINEPRGQNYNSNNGIELVFDYKNEFKEDMIFLSKLGFYSSFKKTNDPWDITTKSRKIKMEWDNTLLIKLAKYLNMNFSLNIENIDITESRIHYEWEQKLNLAFNYKVF
ncbi:MAG TPA: DUF3078 domain-containing protein [bacterium]|nr:DUF3078 domain-containing protein [bacterium]HPP86338.1 DUF3078 domain-containing protein [bacterium]